MSVAEFELVFYKTVVCAAGFSQRGVCSAFHHFPAFEHDYVVGISYGRKPVGHHHDGASAIKFREVFDYAAFVAGVEGVGGLVEEYEVGVAVDGASYEYALLLPLAEAVAFGSYFGVVLQGQSRDLFVVRSISLSSAAMLRAIDSEKMTPSCITTPHCRRHHFRLYRLRSQPATETDPPPGG